LYRAPELYKYMWYNGSKSCI